MMTMYPNIQHLGSNKNFKWNGTMANRQQKPVGLLLNELKQQQPKLSYWQKELDSLLKLTKWTKGGNAAQQTEKQKLSLSAKIQLLQEEFDQLNALLQNDSVPGIEIKIQAFCNKMNAFEIVFKREKMKMLEKLVDEFPVNIY